MRLSTKQVLWCGITALLLSAMSIALIVIPLEVFDNGLPMWAPTASMALAPLPLVIGALGLACQRDLLPPSHTSWAAAISTLSLILGAIAQVSWTAAFTAADVGDPIPVSGRFYVPLGLAAWGLGAAAIAIVLDGVIAERLRRGPRMIIGIVAGAFIAPVGGLALTMSLFTIAGASIVLMVLAFSRGRGVQPATEPAESTEPPQAPVQPRATATPSPARTLTRTRWVRPLGACAALLGLVGLVGIGCAAVRAMLPSSMAPDLMVAGVQVGLFAILPLLAAIGLRFSSSSPHSSIHTWGPIALASLSVAAMAIAELLDSPDLDWIALAMVVSAACGGIAIGWAIIRGARMPAVRRAILAVAAGLLYTQLLGMPLATCAAPVIPLVGGLILTCRRPRTPPSQAARPAGPAPRSQRRPGSATSASPAYRMGMRLGRKTAMGCSITSLLLLALTPVSLAVFLAGTSLVQADADDHPFRWVTGASASLSAAFLAIGLLSLARERGWLAPRHALAAAITSVISCVIGAVANIAMTFSYDAKNLGAPEPLLGHLDMTLNRASWVVLAAAVAIAVSGLTVSRRLDPGLRAVAGIAVGALLAPAVWIAFSFLWMYAMAAPVVLLVVSTADKKPARPPAAAAPWAAAPRVAAAPRAVTTRRIMRDLPQMDLPRWRVRSIRLLGACATALGAVAAACVIMRIIGISAVAPREVLLTLGVPVGLIAFIPLLMALGLWVSGRFSRPAVHVWGPVALGSASAIGLAVLYRLEASGTGAVSTFPAHAAVASCCGAALIWVVLAWFSLNLASRIVGGIGLGLICMVLAATMFRDAISVPPVLGLVIISMSPGLLSPERPRPAVGAPRRADPHPRLGQ